MDTRSCRVKLASHFLLTATFPLPCFLVQIEGFDVKRVDEYHLTGIQLDMFVRWERRPPSSTDGRGENRNEARGEGRSKPEQKKPDDAHYSDGLVSVTTSYKHL